MIAYIKGKVIDKGEKHLVIETMGLGYKVFSSLETLEEIVLGTETSLWTHHAVREDAEDLYGFKDKTELRFFELLIGISGIGPKSALGVLSVASVTSIKKAVFSKDPSYLVQVSGIGKKMADKIVLELKDKLEKEDGDSYAVSREETDALEALKSLGYNQKDAREVLRDLPTSLSTKEKIKEALKILGK